MDIIVTGMHIDGHHINAPHGFSELLNRAGVWSTEVIELPSAYIRKVKRVNGKLVTELRFAGEVIAE